MWRTFSPHSLKTCRKGNYITHFVRQADLRCMNFCFCSTFKTFVIFFIYLNESSVLWFTRPGGCLESASPSVSPAGVAGTQPPELSLAGSQCVQQQEAGAEAEGGLELRPGMWMSQSSAMIRTSVLITLLTILSEGQKDIWREGCYHPLLTLKLSLGSLHV